MTVLLVHPHPDDEAILTGGLILEARARQRRVVLLTATRGEACGGPRAGDPALASVRSHELEEACRLLGVDRQLFLGFHDSGRHRSTPPTPDAFTAVPLAAAAAPIARILREERPEVVVTATPDGTYGHPDHVRAHDATLAALDQLRAEGWVPATLAMVGFPQGPVETAVHAALAFGLRPPAGLLRQASQTALSGTTVRVLPLRERMARKRAAMLAHQSQMWGWLGRTARHPLRCRLVFGAERYLVAASRAPEAHALSLFEHA